MISKYRLIYDIHFFLTKSEKWLFPQFIIKVLSSGPGYFGRWLCPDFLLFRSERVRVTFVGEVLIDGEGPGMRKNV